ncbi:MAG TPA: flagellar assembly protein FliW [Syntrophales bacterium]|nr:flagellar assembly protein FliW [Syntrophales bacterium]
MKISTMRFGVIEIDESRIIDMRGGILGFEHLKKFVLYIRDERTPFWWYQSVGDSGIAFVVIDPHAAKADYEPMISDYDLKSLEIEDAKSIILLAIVTIHQDPFSVSVNLRAPIVINTKRKIGKQIVLEDPLYPIQYYLPVGPFIDEASAEEGQ